MKTKNKVSGKVIIYILLVFFALVFLLPIVWIVFSSAQVLNISPCV